MAKEKETKGLPAKGKVTVVMFQLEGSDDTLRDAIKVLGQGIERLAPGTPVYRVLPPNSGNKNGMLLPLGNSESEPVEAEYANAEEEELAEGSEAASQETSEKPKRRRIQKALVPIKGVDWDSEPSFRDYAKQKKPGNAQERYLVVAGCFKNHRQTEVITPSHIVAAFDVMDWAKPEDIPQQFRVIKHAKSGSIKGQSRMNGLWDSAASINSTAWAGVTVRAQKSEK